jgi:hypothetical protein
MSNYLNVENKFSPEFIASLNEKLDTSLELYANKEEGQIKILFEPDDVFKLFLFTLENETEYNSFLAALNRRAKKEKKEMLTAFKNPFDVFFACLEVIINIK